MRSLFILVLLFLVSTCSAYTSFVPYRYPQSNTGILPQTSSQYPKNANGTQGFSAAISGDGNWAIVGAPFAPYTFSSVPTSSGTSITPGVKGTVLVYQRVVTGNNAEQWNLIQEITPSDETVCEEAGDIGTNFGFSLSISEDGSYLAIAADKDSQGGCRNGALYIYVRDPNCKTPAKTYVEQQKLIPCFPGSPNQQPQTYQDNFAGSGGNSVAINSDGSVAAIGSSSAYEYVGAVVVFYRFGSTWSQDPLTPIIPCNISPPAFANLTVNSTCPFGANLGGPGFGTSVAINGAGNVLVIGAAADRGSVDPELGFFVGPGSTFIYESVGCVNSGNSQFNCQSNGWHGQSTPRPEAIAWLQVQKLIGTPSGAEQAQGGNVAISRDGSTIGVYGPGPAINDGTSAKVYIFEQTPSGYTQVQYINVSPFTQDNALPSTGGIGFDADGSVLAVGVPCSVATSYPEICGIESTGSAPSIGSVQIYQRTNTYSTTHFQLEQTIVDPSNDGSAEEGAVARLDDLGLHLLFTGPAYNDGDGASYVWKRSSE